MSYLIALVTDDSPDAPAAQLAIEAQQAAVRNYTDVVIFDGFPGLPPFSADIDTTDGRPLVVNQLRRAVLESAGVLLFMPDGNADSSVADKVVDWICHPTDGPPVSGLMTAVITAGTETSAAGPLIRRLVQAGAGSLSDPVAVDPTASADARTARLANTVVAVASGT